MHNDKYAVQQRSERETMVTMTLEIPRELKDQMDSYPEINWSEVARQAFTQKLADLEFLKKFTANSTLTKEEALLLGADVNKRLAKRYR